MNSQLHRPINIVKYCLCCSKNFPLMPDRLVCTGCHIKRNNLPSMAIHCTECGRGYDELATKVCQPCFTQKLLLPSTPSKSSCHLYLTSARRYSDLIINLTLHAVVTPIWPGIDSNDLKHGYDKALSRDGCNLLYWEAELAEKYMIGEMTSLLDHSPSPRSRFLWS